MVSALTIGCYKTFAFCFIQFAFTNMARQSSNIVFGKVVKDHLIDGFTTDFLGWLNFAFLFSYGISVLLLGRIGDLYNTKTFLLVGQFLTGILIGLVGVLHNYEVGHKYVLLAAQILNGICQSSGWPSVVTIIDNWFPKYKKLILMGYFAACANVGNISGDIVAGVSLGHFHLQVYWPITITAILILAITTFNFFFLNAKPSLDRSLNYDLELSELVKSQGVQTTQPLNYLTVWLVPGVALYAIAFGFVKSIYYCVGNFLPLYLDSLNLDGPTTYILAMLDLGSIPGGIIVCYIGFYTNKRALVIVPCLILGTLIMITTDYLKDVHDAYFFYVILVFLMGLFIGGVYNNIGGAIGVELGGQFKGNKKAVASIVSVLEGYGSIFAAINQIVVAQIPNNIFPYCGLLCLLTAITLSPFLKKELIKKQSKETLQKLVLVNKNQNPAMEQSRMDKSQMSRMDKSQMSKESQQRLL